MAKVQGPIHVPKESFIVPKQPSLVLVDKVSSKPIELTPAPTTAVSSRTSSLQELDRVENLIITRHLVMKSTLLFRGKRNKFSVSTSDGAEIYTVEEKSRWWSGYLLYAHRPLQLIVKNSNGDTVMVMDRPYAMTARVVPCQTQIMRVYAPENNPIGNVEQKWTAVKPVYKVKDKSGNTVFRIKGPFVTINYIKVVKFRITKPDGTLVAVTDKKREGVMHTLFYSAVNHKYGLHFDTDINVEEKGLLLAATLLLNYMYYDD